ncbi:glycosyltransferase family 4 protein [Salininema proteolyticum]|uniref:Glycosyltransferase family 4 protein n=1 Tax=Salininema proteolyticum TaxID=1607685 RepID=A0ABV8TY49_9ACTN
MRIAIVTESYLPQVNGVSYSVHRLAEFLHSHGHETLVMAPSPSRRQVAPHTPWPVHHVPSVGVPRYREFRFGIATRGVRRALREFRPDVIHLASPFGFPSRACAYAAEAGVPVVATWQTDLPSYSKIYGLGRLEPYIWRRFRSIHSHAAVNIALSDDSAQAMRGNGIENVTVIAHGVDTDRFRPSARKRERRAVLAPDGEFLVGYVGRLAREKHLHLLRETSEIPGVKLLVVGGGPAEKSLRAALPRAQFTGVLTGDDLSETYASLDLFVHPGPFETFGRTVQEAHASGLPVLTVAAGGAGELVRPGLDGDYIELDGPSIAAKVAELTNRRDMLADWGRAGRRRAEESLMASEHDQLLEHLSRAARAKSGGAVS